MKYLHLFENELDFNAEYKGSNYIEPWVSLTKSVERVDYNKPYDPYLHIPFTIEALDSGNISWALDDKTVQYSKNGGSWETMDNKTTISVVEGDGVQFKGTNTDYNYCTISTTMQFNVKGNIMSLTDGDEFETADAVNANGFNSLFYGCSYLVSAGDLKLPATTLANRCYLKMFQGCTSLTKAPELPATTLTEDCYNDMFQGCPSLTKAPELPATTLAAGCCYSMFAGCTSLTTAPKKLPATTLTEDCYSLMFDDCASLTKAPELPATTLAENCYNCMFQGCTSLNYIKAMFTTVPSTTYTDNWVNGVASTGTFVKNAAATWTTTGSNAVPSGWTIQTASE